MYLFLSSGYRERYRQDILRAIAMPEGSILQFRYEEGLLAKAVRDLPVDTAGTITSLVGARGLIAFLDRHGEVPAPFPDTPPDLVPCRFVEVTQAVKRGKNVILKLRVKEFVSEFDVNGFNAEVRQEYAAAGGRFPGWVERDGWAIDADFIAPVKDHLESVKPVPTTDLRSWQALVDVLNSRWDYRDEQYFFTFGGIRRLGSDERLIPNGNGVYSLTPTEEYDLLVYHYFPKDEPAGPAAELVVTASNPVVMFTSSTTFRLDSAYDEKVAQFYVGVPGQTVRTVLALSGQVAAAAGATPKVTAWFDVDIEVRRRNWLVTLQGVAVGVLVALAPIANAFANDKLELGWKYGIAALALLGSCAAGVVAAFNFKKPI